MHKGELNVYFLPFIRVTVRVDRVHKGELESQISFKQVQRKQADFVKQEKWVNTSDDFGAIGL